MIPATLEMTADGQIITVVAWVELLWCGSWYEVKGEPWVEESKCKHARPIRFEYDNELPPVASMSISRPSHLQIRGKEWEGRRCCVACWDGSAILRGTSSIPCYFFSLVSFSFLRIRRKKKRWERRAKTEWSQRFAEIRSLTVLWEILSSVL